MFSYETSHNRVFQKHELDDWILSFPHLKDKALATEKGGMKAEKMPSEIRKSLTFGK